MTRTAKMTAVEVRDLVVKGQQGFALEVPSLEIGAGETVALVGKNGSGKSTFLEAILDLLLVDKGTVRLFGETIRGLPARHPLRKRIGVQAQGTTWAWSITVGEIIAIHTTLYRHTSREILDQLGVPALAKSLYRKLSTGQRRRVDLAVALAHEPDLIVLDEPSSGLDKNFAAALHAIIETRSRAGATILVATHEALDVAAADRILWFHNGKLIEDSPPAALVHQKVGEFVGLVNDVGAADEQALHEELTRLSRPQAAFPDARKYFGDDTLRQPFIKAMERHQVAGYEVRPADASDLLELMIETDQDKGPLA
jgi:ABC-2 type transport system ATP-binding protein